jgi:hypothetical protein
MSEEKRWRLRTFGEEPATGPVTAEDAARCLWAADTELLLAEPVQPGESTFAQDVPEIRDLLLANPERVAHAWLKHPGYPAPEWLFLWVVETCQDHPEQAWPLLLQLVELAVTDLERAHVVIGPIEEMLVRNGPRMIGSIEVQASRDSRFREMLSEVRPLWIDEAVWRRVQQAAGATHPSQG